MHEYFERLIQQLHGGYSHPSPNSDPALDPALTWWQRLVAWWTNWRIEQWW